MASESEPRPIVFNNLTQVVGELDSMVIRGYAQLGQWNLTQICGHLDLWMAYPMNGYPKPGIPVNLMLWVGKMTIGKRLLHKIITEKKMKPGAPTMPSTVLEAKHKTDQQAVDELKKTIAAFESFNGTVHASPFFGAMDYETARRLQLVHCAHHLGFLVPKKT